MAPQPGNPDDGPPGDDPLASLRAQLEQLTPQLLAWSCVRLHGRPRADAEDLTQDVLCRALLRLPAYDGDNLAAWVFAIAKRVMLEHLRRRRRTGRIAIADGHSSMMQRMDEVSAAMTTLTRKVSRGEEVQQVLALCEGLDEVDRQLVLLCGMEGCTCKDAAVQVGLNEEATQKRWYRLRKKLHGAVSWLRAEET
jgi:RNA polymerase sigma factor (sigma-70 family)